MGKEVIFTNIMVIFRIDTEFTRKTIYKEELKTMKNREEIQRYNYIERKDNYWAEIREKNAIINEFIDKEKRILWK